MKQIKLINSKITTAIAFACLLSGNVMAEQNNPQQSNQQQKTNEVIGLSSGAIIGTIVAGPLGGMIASIFGVMIADNLNSDKKLETANASLKQKQQQLLVMQQNFEQSKKHALQQIASIDNALQQAVLNENILEIESNIQFKTASYILEKHYQSQLDLIAQTLQKNPKLSIALSGFADRRGDSQFNQALSEQRVLTVKNYLVNIGVKQEQVITNSYGESSLVSTEANFEDDFFDRRVMLKVSDNQAKMIAATQ